MQQLCSTHLCQTRQVDESQVQDIRREDLEVYGLAVDALVAAGDSRRLVLDLALDVAEVGKPPVRDVMELGPLVPTSFVRVAVGAHGVLLLIPRDVDQLENKRSPGDDAAAAGK